MTYLPGECHNVIIQRPRGPEGGYGLCNLFKVCLIKGGKSYNKHLQREIGKAPKGLGEAIEMGQPDS